MCKSSREILFNLATLLLPPSLLVQNCRMECRGTTARQPSLHEVIFDFSSSIQRNQTRIDAEHLSEYENPHQHSHHPHKIRRKRGQKSTRKSRTTLLPSRSHAATDSAQSLADPAPKTTHPFRNLETH